MEPRGRPERSTLAPPRSDRYVGPNQVMTTKTKHLKLNIGWGNDVYPGFEGVDVIAGPSVRFVQTLKIFPVASRTTASTTA